MHVNKLALFLICLVSLLRFSSGQTINPDFEFSITPPENGQRDDVRVVIYTGVPMRTLKAPIYLNSSCSSTNGMKIPRPVLQSFSFYNDTDLYLSPNYLSHRFGTDSTTDLNQCMNVEQFATVNDYRYATITVPPGLLGTIAFSASSPILTWTEQQDTSTLIWNDCDSPSSVDAYCTFSGIVIDPLYTRTCDSTISVWPQLGIYDYTAIVRYPTQIPSSTVISCPSNETQILSPSSLGKAVIFDFQLHKFAITDELNYWDLCTLYGLAWLFSFISIVAIFTPERTEWWSGNDDNEDQDELKRSVVHYTGRSLWKPIAQYVIQMMNVIMTSVYFFVYYSYNGYAMRAAAEPTYGESLDGYRTGMSVCVGFLIFMWLQLSVLYFYAWLHSTPISIATEMIHGNISNTCFLILAVLNGPIFRGQIIVVAACIGLLVWIVREFVYLFPQQMRKVAITVAASFREELDKDEKEIRYTLNNGEYNELICLNIILSAGSCLYLTSLYTYTLIQAAMPGYVTYVHIPTLILILWSSSAFTYSDLA